MKELTKAEEEIMQLLWKKEPCTVREVLNAFKNNAPAYTTVATIVRILEEKGFVSHKAVGKTYLYSSQISKEEYRSRLSKSVLDRYFSGSAQQLVQFFVKEKNLSVQELEDVLKEMKKS